ncbi:MAG: hypothetical protein ACI87E_004031 [Mariniblastus sp.]|jgi:hypothetical protein
MANRTEKTKAIPQKLTWVFCEKLAGNINRPYYSQATGRSQFADTITAPE